MLLACESDTREGSAEDIARGGCPVVGDLSVVEVNLFGQASACEISGTLTESATLPSALIWFLDGQLRVDGGTTSDIRLTVEPGTDVRGGQGDSIYIASGSGLFAVGSKIAPISFGADRDVTNFSANYSAEGGGLWGGVIIEDSLATNARTRMEYVVISDGGEPVTINTVATYSDNLTLVGDHSNTSIRFLQSHDSARDGIRLQGSSSNQNIARMDWILITGAGRDGISYQYFSGLLKNSLVIHRQGIFDAANNRGGRAGLFASGAGSLPLIINVTLAGQDNTVVSASSAADDPVGESGIILDEDVNGIRIANTLIVNFRNGCTDLLDDADVSMATFDNDLTSASGFVDGLHCVNDFGLGDSWHFRVDNDVPMEDNSFKNFPTTVIGNGDGASFYAGMNIGINFFGESTLTDSFTARWFAESITSGLPIVNGLVNDFIGLNAYRSGDTNNSSGGGVVNASDVDSTDIGFLPLLGDTDFGSVDGFSGSGLSGDPRGYDLTHIGAILSANGDSSTFDSNNPDNGDQFDGWTVQNGFLTVTITGFDPISPPP